MPLPDDSNDRLRCYRNALTNWKYEGYLEFRQRARDWLRGRLSDRTLLEIKRLLFEYAVTNGGTIDECVESRKEYLSYEFHYDLRLKVDNCFIYFETILICDKPDDPDDPRIVVVNVHDV